MQIFNFKTILQIAAGTFILAVSVVYFILPFNILSGGVAGIAVAIDPLFGYTLNKTLVANLLVLVLLIVGTIFLGRDFFINTALSSLLYPVFTSVLTAVAHIPDIPEVLASFYGGLLGGIGIGIVMRAGASTGGMDIPPMIINKITGIKIGTLVAITDGLTVLLGYFAYDLSAVLIGLVSVFATSVSISRTLTFGGTVSKSVQIISDDWEKITKIITGKYERGATVFDAVGSYSGQGRKVILCVVSERQYSRLIEDIQSIDDKAFIITTDATDMHGEGFTYGARI